MEPAPWAKAQKQDADSAAAETLWQDRPLQRETPTPLQSHQTSQTADAGAGKVKARITEKMVVGARISGVNVVAKVKAEAEGAPADSPLL